jgi:MFS family permease
MSSLQRLAKRQTHSMGFMLLLGIPSFGLTFGVTILTAFLPLILRDLVNPLTIGLIIGAEGIFGLFIPLVFGVLADRSKTVAGRWKYLVPATLAMAVSLVLMGVFRHVWMIAPMVALFYLGYFCYQAPNWAIYPDLIAKRFSGRSRSAESSWRVIGAFLALVSGGFLLTLWRPLAFILSAALICLVTIIFAYAIREHESKKIKTRHETIRGSLDYISRVLKRNPNIRNLMIANALWNAALQSIQAFSVLFFTQGLHRSAHFASGVIFPVAAIGILAMAPIAGRLADKRGHYKILLVSTLIYGLGALIPTFTQDESVILIVPLVAGAAVTIMTLPYSALMRLIKGHPHGAISGLFGISRGIGTFLGPIITGATIQTTRGIFKSTNGYAGVRLSVAVFVLASLPFLLRIRSDAI